MLPEEASYKHGWQMNKQHICGYERCTLLRFAVNCKARCSGFVFFQLFYSFFKSLVGKDVVVELKNDLRWAIIES